MLLTYFYVMINEFKSLNSISYSSWWYLKKTTSFNCSQASCKQKVHHYVY